MALESSVMLASQAASTSASTSAYPSSTSISKQSHPLPKKPRLEGGFQQQDDFISFSDVLEDEDRPQRGQFDRHQQNGRNGKRALKRNIADVLQEKGKGRLKEAETSTPWTTGVDWDRHASATEQLSAEIRAFSEYINPADFEHQIRLDVIQDIRNLISNRWRDAQVHAFGSFQTRLYLPTGDIDLVVMCPSISQQKPQQKKVLYLLSGLLSQSKIGKDIIVIAKARVPIVKFVSIRGNFKIDISLNMTNGLNVGKRVQQLFSDVGENTARALILVVKAFLSQRSMNEVYTGGLGSYSIICLVVSFLQLHPKLQRREIKAWDNLGTLLIEFLELYGKHFNYEDVGICLSSGGSYYSKSRRGWARPNQPYLLSVEDPADPTNDVSGGSHNILSVRQSLAGAYEVLTAAVFQRHSVMISRIAAAQSGTTLPTLSDRDIPRASGTTMDDDECRRSLLGSILGVTDDMLQFRRDLRHLAGLPEEELPRAPAPYAQPTVAPLGVPQPSTKKARKNRPDVERQTVSAGTQQAPAEPKPAKSTNISKDATGRKEADQMHNRPKGATHSNGVVIEVHSSPVRKEPNEMPVQQHLNGSSPKPETPQQSDEESDEVSRYSVKKQSKAKTPRRLYVISDDSNDSDKEEGEISTKKKPAGKPNQPAKSKFKPTSPAEALLKRRRSSESHSRSTDTSQRKPLGKSGRSSQSKHGRSESDMDISSGSSDGLSRKKSAQKSARKLSNQKKRDYWEGKSSRDEVASDSSDVVEVRAY